MTNIRALAAEFSRRNGEICSMRDERDDLDAESYVPALGRVLWQAQIPSGTYAPLEARIYQRVDRPQRIGYLRVPHYRYDESVIDSFADAVARLERETDVLVYDQVGNRGGSMFHMYVLMSHLIDRPLKSLPMHHLRLAPSDIAVAKDVLDEAALGAARPLSERPSPELVQYSTFVLDEVAAGRGMKGCSEPVTRLVHLAGISSIEPAEKHYTKPVVVVNDRKTFSAGEFLAASLQDGKRAVIFGETTAGGGGCARRVDATLISGDWLLTITWTLAYRANGLPIENVGVIPDVECSRTPEDLRTAYAGYGARLMSALSNVG